MSEEIIQCFLSDDLTECRRRVQAVADAAAAAAAALEAAANNSTINRLVISSDASSSKVVSTWAQTTLQQWDTIAPNLVKVTKHFYFTYHYCIFY